MGRDQDPWVPPEWMRLRQGLAQQAIQHGSGQLPRFERVQQILLDDLRSRPTVTKPAPLGNCAKRERSNMDRVNAVSGRRFTRICAPRRNSPSSASPAKPRTPAIRQRRRDYPDTRNPTADSTLAASRPSTPSPMIPTSRSAAVGGTGSLRTRSRRFSRMPGRSR